MGSTIVVVKRNRRRAFALLWAGPAWLRAVVVGARALLGANDAVAIVSHNTASRKDCFAEDGAFRIPALSRNEEGDHACTSCRRCAEICPSCCLEVEGISESAGGTGVDRFQLDLGRCIGCGDCVAVCPESALHLASPKPGFRALTNGDGALRRDLLAEGASA